MANLTVVGIPARDEAERIGPCLIALNEQLQRPDAVVLLLNNCADTTEAIARAMAPDLRFRLHLICRDLAPNQATAGHARRLVMQAADELAGPNDVLLTTDADAVVPSDWISGNVKALRQGADIVCGRAIIDPVEAALIPAHLHADDALECKLIALLDDIAWILDAESHDPPLRHTEASGASLAVRADAFRRAGGIPSIACGEDRAFVRALWMIDARVRHDPTVRVTVSGRVIGRADGGMADAIRRRMIEQDAFTDEQVEPAANAFKRYSLRHRVRRAWRGADDFNLADDLGLSQEILQKALTQRFFGQCWAGLEAISPNLRRQRVRFVDLASEIVSAETLLRRMAVPEIMAAD